MKTKTTKGNYPKMAGKTTHQPKNSKLTKGAGVVNKKGK